MNIKSKLLTILFFSLSTFAFSQDYKKEIESQFRDYNNLIIKKDFNKSMEYVPEDLFKIVPKEQMVVLMEKIFNNTEMDFEMTGLQIKDISDCEKIEDKFYSLLNYSSFIKMKLKNNEREEETETEHKLRMNLVKLSFENAYGTGNVKYHEQSEIFEVNVPKQAYAMSKDGKTAWKFLVIENKQKILLERLIPKQLVEKL